MQLIQAFYNKTYYERSGGNWEHVVAYENHRMAVEENNSKAINYTSSDPGGNPTVALPANVSVALAESFGVDREKLLEKWQLEILWSTTVALFVFFGMIGAFSSAKVADFFGR